MRPRIPRPPAPDRREPGPHARLDAELAAVLAGARRRAVRDGDRQIDTAHLLHSLLESDPGVRALTGDAPQLARLLGYLVQRSIGYGLRWQSTVEDSGALPVVTAGESADGEPGGAKGWSPLAAAAMAHAHDRAARHGGQRPRGADLLAGLVLDPRARAVEVLRHAGIEPGDLPARIDSLPRPAGETGPSR